MASEDRQRISSQSTSRSHATKVEAGRQIMAAAAGQITAAAAGNGVSLTLVALLQTRLTQDFQQNPEVSSLWRCPVNERDRSFDRGHADIDRIMYATTMV